MIQGRGGVKLALLGVWLTHPPTHLPDTLRGGGVTEQLSKKNSPFSLYMVLEQKKADAKKNTVEIEPGTQSYK